MDHRIDVVLDREADRLLESGLEIRSPTVRAVLTPAKVRIADVEKPRLCHDYPLLPQSHTDLFLLGCYQLYK